MASNPVAKLTEEQYLALERAAETRSEFVNGEMFAMSGGSRRHSAISVNLIYELRGILRGQSCRPYNSDFRVRTASGVFTYPDVSLVCGEPEVSDEWADTLLNPTVLIEVLSPSTEAYDRGLKFQHYRTIESLRDYLLVDQAVVHVEQYTRQADGDWLLRDHRAGAEIVLDSIGVRLPVDRIYEGVDAA